MIKQWCQGDWEVLLTHIEDKLLCQWQICLQADELHSAPVSPWVSCMYNAVVVLFKLPAQCSLHSHSLFKCCLLILRYINLFSIMSDSDSELHADSYMAQPDLWFCCFMGPNMPKNMNQLSHVWSQGDHHYGFRCCQVFFRAVTYFLTFPFAN